MKQITDLGKKLMAIKGERLSGKHKLESLNYDTPLHTENRYSVRTYCIGHRTQYPAIHDKEYVRLVEIKRRIYKCLCIRESGGG